MKKVALFGMLLAGAYYYWTESSQQNTAVIASEPGTGIASGSFVAPASGSQTQGSGVVIRLLADDNDGSRHQRFFLEVGSGLTLLIAHNIDLAPRISGLKVGDSVEFFGEYEWNNKGGVIHWTHHDPDGRHVTGWLKHGGRTYQ